MLTLFWRR